MFYFYFLFFFFYFFIFFFFFFFFSSRRRHTRSLRDWSSDVCSSDLIGPAPLGFGRLPGVRQRISVAEDDDEGRALARAALLRKSEQFLVHRLVLDRVYQKIRAGSERVLGHDELGRVHGNARSPRVGRVA